MTTRGATKKLAASIGFVLLFLSGCTGLVLWDVKIAGETARSRFNWTLSGDSVNLRTWQKTSTSGRPSSQHRYQLSDSEKTKILRILRSDHLQGMARRYKNRCVEDPKTLEVKIQHPKGTLKTRQIGYVHPALTRLLEALRETNPKASNLSSKCPPYCATHRGAGAVAASNPRPTSRPRKSPAFKKSAPRRSRPAASGSCMSPDMGIHHEVINELWRGKAAVVNVLAPEGWTSFLRYKPALAPHYLSLPMKPQNPRNPCAIQAVIPQSALNYDTLYYYIETNTAAGKQVTGSGSLNSPHVVTVEQCLVVGKD